MDTLSIVKRIDAKLSELGMSKAEFYKRSGISSASFSQWRTGVYNPTEKKLLSAAECLGVSLQFLKTGTEEKEKPTTEPGDELNELLERLKNRPECRMLFQLADGATAEDVRKAVAIIEALRKED